MNRCTCAGKYYDNWHRWRVIERAERSRLYCLGCRRQWRSGAKYTALLPDHKIRRQSGLTDDEILQRVRAGSLVVDVNRAVVRNDAGHRLKVIEREHIDGAQRGTYRFVKICSGGRQKKIALHRLVWMAAHGRVVPPGHDVDHINDQCDDTISNLRLLESSENRALPHRKEAEEVPF